MRLAKRDDIAKRHVQHLTIIAASSHADTQYNKPHYIYFVYRMDKNCVSLSLSLFVCLCVCILSVYSVCISYLLWRLHLPHPSIHLYTLRAKQLPKAARRRRQRRCAAELYLTDMEENGVNSTLCVMADGGVSSLHIAWWYDIFK